MRVFAILALLGVAQAVETEADLQVAADVEAKTEAELEGILGADDDDTDPVCYLGGLRGQVDDSEWPKPLCCRVYEQADFMGKYMDFCAEPTSKNPEPKSFYLDDYNGMASWNNEISSWKCGVKVAGFFCRGTSGAAIDDCTGD